MPDGPRVLIVGAGVGGLTLAAGLQHFGIVPTVAEIEGSSLGRGLALMLTSNVGLALRRIGLDRAVAREGTALEEIVQTDAFGASRTVMECLDGDRVFTIRSMPGTLLGSFQVGPQLVYAFLLVHASEIPSLSRAQHLARFKELASTFHGPIPALIQEQQDPTRV